MAGRMIETSLKEEDIRVEGSLRPKQLDDYIGQSKIKENLKILKRQRNDRIHWIMLFFMDRLGLVRRRWQVLLPMKCRSI